MNDDLLTKWVWFICLLVALMIVLMLLTCGCTGSLMLDSFSDPNTVAAVGNATRDVGIITGNPEIIGVGVILGGVALMLRNAKGKKK